MEPQVATSAPNPSTGLLRPLLPVVAPMPPEPVTIAALFESEEGGLLRYALGLVGRRAVAEELVQEAFLRLYQVWAQVENPRAWLYRSLRNLALNHLRDRREDGTLDADNLPTSDRLPAEVLGRMEAIGMVETLLAEMPDDDRALVLLKYREDLKYHEISRRTGLAVGTVGYKLHHLLKGLADALRRAGIEGSRG